MERGEDLFSIHVDLDDWYTDGEVLEKLAKLTGASTMGGAIQAISAGELSGDGILSTRVSKVGTKHVGGRIGPPVRGWDDLIVRPVKWVGDSTRVITDELTGDDG
ncbi:hypothetical protein DRQ50_11740 [bacterium]|nr:MAG: hypothetical protein DRQ50_11740 [bacterium]